MKIIIDQPAADVGLHLFRYSSDTFQHKATLKRTLQTFTKPDILSLLIFRLVNDR